MGSVYENGEQLAKVLAELTGQMFAGEGQKEKFADLGVTVKFSITDPDCVVFLDPQGAEVVNLNDDRGADLTLSMSADFMHDFWLGKVDIMESLEKGEMVITAGDEVPAVKSVDLLPLLLPGQEIYPGLL